MRKLLLVVGGIFAAVCGASAAPTPADWNYIPLSSYTDVTTPGPILFTSATIQFVGITVNPSSATGTGYVALYRSTTPVFTSDIATQTLVNTAYQSYLQAPIFIPLFEMKNTSYTFLSKTGNAQVTLWIRCVPPTKARTGICPGLPWNGSMSSKVEYP